MLWDLFWGWLRASPGPAVGGRSPYLLAGCRQESPSRRSKRWLGIAVAVSLGERAKGAAFSLSLFVGERGAVPRPSGVSRPNASRRRDPGPRGQ